MDVQKGQGTCAIEPDTNTIPSGMYGTTGPEQLEGHPVAAPTYGHTDIVDTAPGLAVESAA